MIYKKKPEIKGLKLYTGGPISFSGPPAVGKSTIGKLVADELNFDFFDLDNEIAKEAKVKTTKDVIQEKGHKYFKKVQNECLKRITETSPVDNYVLAAGGEIVRPGYNSDIIEQNRQLLKKYTYNICLLPSQDLDEAVNILYPRLNDGKRDTRTKGSNEFKTYIEISKLQYLELADMVVFTHNSSVSDTFLSILESLSNEKSLN